MLLKKSEHVLYQNLFYCIFYIFTYTLIDVELYEQSDLRQVKKVMLYSAGDRCG
jgi:hypothetical protein